MAVLANMRELVRRPGSLTPKYGLFTVTAAMGTLADSLPVHSRQGGVEYETAVCDLPTCFETNCIDILGVKPAGVPYDVVRGDPFVVLTSLLCGSVGMTDEVLREKLRERALAGEQSTVESTFSTGACGAEPSLSNSAIPATALALSPNVVEAVSALEAALCASYGLPGVLHVPYSASAFMMQAYQIYRDPAGVWRTPAGTYVSFGNYAGLSPTGVAPAAGNTFIYITGQVSIWRSPESDVFYTPLSGALNRSTNQVNGFREREYVVTYECGAFATETTLVVV
ncbi:MAG: hypothetical protein ACREIE_00570 [Nitrospiraceae bacterium]